MTRTISNAWVAAIVILAVWDLAWRLPALWRAAKRHDLAWFLVIGIVNSVGILPIIYLATHKE